MATHLARRKWASKQKARLLYHPLDIDKKGETWLFATQAWRGSTWRLGRGLHLFFLLKNRLPRGGRFDLAVWSTTIAMDTAQIVLMDGSLQQLTSLFDPEEFNGTLNKSFMMTVIPNLICIGGTYLLHWGLLTAVIFNAFFWLPEPSEKQKLLATSQSILWCWWRLMTLSVPGRR